MFFRMLCFLHPKISRLSENGGFVTQSVYSVHETEEIASFPVEPIFSEQDDWSFAHLTLKHTLWGPHGYHRYPAKFIPQLVRRIIETYSLPNDRIGDPFLGSATTGIEALRTQRYFYGSDIHPVALLISKAKCSALEPQKLHAVWNTLQQHITTYPRITKRTLTAQELDVVTSISIAHASREERFAYWFPVHHSYVSSLILESIQEIAEEQVRIFSLCAFSNILRNCSIWLSGSTKPQKDFRKMLGDPVEELSRQVQSMLKRNALYWEDLRTWTPKPDEIAQRVTLVQEDVRHLSLPHETLDLLVTSPPYATCYEYSSMHQLTQLWFEKYNIFDSSPFRYIGTRVLSHKPKSQNILNISMGAFSMEKALQALQNTVIGNTQPSIQQEIRVLRQYFQDMYEALCECARVVAVHKRLVLIVGDSYR